MDGPGLSVTLVYEDTLTYIGEYMSGNPCTTLDCQSNSGLQSGGQTRHGTTGKEWSCDEKDMFAGSLVLTDA